jgi:hypothetical protein
MLPPSVLEGEPRYAEGRRVHSSMAGREDATLPAMRSYPGSHCGTVLPAR